MPTRSAPRIHWRVLKRLAAEAMTASAPSLQVNLGEETDAGSLVTQVRVPKSLESHCFNLDQLYVSVLVV